MIMKKFIPFAKLSKKEKRKRNARDRRNWGTLNPTTRVPPNPKVYDRNKEKAKRNSDADSLFFVFTGFRSAPPIH